MNSNSNSTQTLESIFEFPPELCPDGLSLENFEECLSKYLSTMHAKGPKQPRAAISKQQKVRTAEKLCLAGSFSTETCRVSPFCEITGTGDGLNTVLLKAPAEGQGRWMFEAILCTSGVMQIGWANSSCMFNADSGVGDEPHSFGIDGKRSTFWCGKDSIDLDIDWVSGDVISSIIDISARTLTFYRNGMLVSVIDVPGISKTVKYFPAISLPKNERAIINLGDLPFMFRIKDTFTLRAEPSNTVKAKVRYVIKSLFRLIRTEENNSSGSAISPDEVAIMACQLLDCLMTVLQGEAGIDNAPALLLTELMPVINVLRSGSKGVFLTKFFELFQGAFSNEYLVWFVRLLIKHYSVCWKCFSVGKTIDKLEAIDNVVFVLSCAKPLVKVKDILSSETMLEDILGLKYLTRKDLSVLLAPLRGGEAVNNVVKYLSEHGGLHETYQAAVKKQLEVVKMLYEDKLLIPWLNYLVNKNLDINKAFIPSGLSSLTTLSNVYVLTSCFVASLLPSTLSATTPLVKQMCYNFSGFRAETERVGGAVSYLLKEHGIPTVPPADSACSDLWEVLDLCAHIFCLGEKRMRVQSWAMRDAIKNGWFAYTLEPGVSSEFDGLAQKLAWYLDLSFRVEASVNDKILNAFIEIIELCLREKEHSNSNDNDSVLCFVPNAYFEVVLNPGITGERSLFDPKVLLLLFALAEQDVLVNPDLKRSLSAVLLGLLGNPLSTAIFGSQILAQGYAKALLALLARDEAALLRFFSPETDKESLGRVLRAERCGGLVDSFFDRVFELVNKTFTDLQMEMSQLETRNGAKLSLPYAKSLFAHAGRGASCMAGLEAVTHLFSAEVVVGRELNFFRMCEFAVYLLDRIPAYTKYLAEIFGGGYRGGNGSGSSDDDDDDVHIIASYEISLMKVLNELCIMCKGDYGRMENMLGRFANFRLSSLTRLAEAHKDVVPKEFADLCTFLKQHKDGKSTGTKCNKSNGSNNTKDSSPAPTDEEEEEHDVVKEALEQSSLDDSSLCEICYTNKKDTVFVPCGHSSCRLCIERHMTTEKTCFFCKKEITTLKSN